MSANADPNGPDGPPNNDAARDRESQADANESANPPNRTPEAEVRVFLERLFQPGDVFEVRALGCWDNGRPEWPFTVSGYYQYERIATAADHIAKMDATGRAPVIYVTLNPVLGDLLARSPNKLARKAKTTTGDAEVPRRRNLLIDCDPVRPSAISSTERELELARVKAEAVLEFLTARGWPRPMRVMSGSGWHLVYRIDLPADDDGLVERFLDALAARFNDAAVTIDASVHNPARITKVAGTVAASKGAHFVGVKGFEDRPHRRAKLVHAPDQMVVVTREQLESLAGPKQTPPPPKPPPPGSTGRRGQQFDRFDHTPEGVRGYLAARGIVVKGEKRDTDGTWLYLDRCPVVPECASTGESDIGVFVGDDGKIAYRNQHNRGRDLKWLDVREALEPGYKEFAQSGGRPLPEESVRTVAGVTLQALGLDGDGRLIVQAIAADGRTLALDIIKRASATSRRRLIKDIISSASLDDDDAAALDAALLEIEPPPADAAQESPPSPADVLAARDEATRALLDAMPADVVAEAEAALLDPNLMDRIDADIARIGVVGERPLRVVTYVIGTGRLLSKPVSGIVQGTSSSGKSFVLEKVGTLFPDEAVLRATDLTANALYYLAFGELMHCFVLAGERSRVEDDQKAETKRALREMLSAGELRKVLPVALPQGGFETRTVYQPGPIAFMESTTNTIIMDEDANRCLLLSTDETPEQTARIIDAAAAAAEGGPVNLTRLVLVHHALQRSLKRVEVRVPFARKLARAIPKNRPEARRAFGQIISLIKAIALLHQRQRKAGPIEHGDVIEATIGDYVIARRLLSGPLGRSLGGALPDAVTRFAKRLAEEFKDRVFSSTEALRADAVLSSKGKVNDYLRALMLAGVLECVEEGKGSKPRTYRRVGDVPEPGAAWLPTVEDIEGGQP